MASGVVRAGLFIEEGVSLIRVSGTAVPCFEQTSFPAALFKRFLLQTASINSVRDCIAPALKKGFVGAWDFKFL